MSHYSSYHTNNLTSSQLYSTDTSLKKTRGCLSYISNIRTNRHTTVEPSTKSMQADYTYRRPNLVSARSYTVAPTGRFSQYTRAHTEAPSISRTYGGYYSRTQASRYQDYVPRTTWYKPSR